MAKQFRLLVASMCLPATALLGMTADADAQDRWSDPATWPSGEVPGDGDAVTIGRDMDLEVELGIDSIKRSARPTIPTRTTRASP